MKINNLIAKEKKRQQQTLMMIPSQNYAFSEVHQACSSWFMHKYSEGYPGKRYYQGNKFIDRLELTAQKNALQAFNLNSGQWGVNVQPYSGSIANLAVYNGLVEAGEKMMAMKLTHGGHLSHGWHTKSKKITLSSKIWDFDFYGVDKKSGVFNYQELKQRAIKIQPRLIVSGGTAYPREIDHSKMHRIAQKVGAYYLADVAHEAGLIAGGVNQSPFEYADVVTVTTQKTLRGPRAGVIFGHKDLMVKINRSVFPGIQGGPHNHTIAGMAVCFKKTKTKEFKEYVSKTIANAQCLADELLNYNFDLVSGGTDKHLILIDLNDKEVNGWFAGWALETAGIIANRNTIPFESGSAYYPSGLRLGTPALTVRGMNKPEMKKIAKWINQVITRIAPVKIPEDKNKRQKKLREFKENIQTDKFLKEINNQVKKLCKKFPIYK